MNARMILTAAMAIALAAPLGAVPPRTSVKAMEAQSMRLNDDCRDHLNDASCAARDRVDRELRRRGICWAYSDMRGLVEADFDWHPCSQPRPLKHRP